MVGITKTCDSRDSCGLGDFGDLGDLGDSSDSTLFTRNYSESEVKLQTVQHIFVFLLGLKLRLFATAQLRI